MKSSMIGIMALFGCVACGAASQSGEGSESAATPAQAAAPKKHKVAYHLNEPGVEKAKAVLGNIRNHVTGVGGWGNIAALELVVHGAAVKGFMSDGVDPDLKQSLDKLVAEGMVLTVCGNTLTKMSTPREKLVNGCNVYGKGGVVRLAELQELGYAYIRP